MNILGKEPTAQVKQQELFVPKHCKHRLCYEKVCEAVEEYVCCPVLREARGYECPSVRSPVSTPSFY